MTEGTVAVALSGGEDSSVAALLLREAGYKVMGIYMRLGDLAHSQQREYQAERVCHVLGIPFQAAYLHKEFEQYVVNYFCQEYEKGRTPNPCAACNQHIKFGFLLDKALSSGADYLATGHYARIKESGCSYLLLKARDANKDQSYFLYTLNQEKLRHILFPVGIYTKARVRQIAERAGIPLAAKPSQDICFISQKNYHAFLSQRFPSKPGDVTDTQGKILGRHRGIAFYTIGQRRGLGLASGRPLYVIKIEPESNRIVLGEENELYSQKVIARDLRWIGDKAPPGPVAVAARIRYKSREAEAILFPTCHCEQGETIAEIRFSQPQRAIAPGQSIVFYRGDEVLGGGIIESSQIVPLNNERREYVTAT